MANRLGKGFCIGGTYHQFGAFRPPFDLVPAECPSINMLCERPAQKLGQVSDRNDDLDRVAVDKHEPGIRVNRLDLAERKNMVGALQRPTARTAGTVLKVLQEALVKPKSVK